MNFHEIEVNVPASSGNIGSGFDCVGIAVDIWNKITLTQDINSSKPPTIKMKMGNLRH